MRLLLLNQQKSREALLRSMHDHTQMSAAQCPPPLCSLTDADLLRRANLVAAIPRDDQPSFAAACGKDEEMHRLALELAATKLPLALNRNLCMFTAPELICCTEPELPMPLPLFFALLSAHATLCSCLVNRGASEAERCQIQRAALPILHGIVQASGAGYGYGMAGRGERVRMASAERSAAAPAPPTASGSQTHFLDALLCDLCCSPLA